MVAGVVVALAGLSGVGYVLSIASSAPLLDSLRPADKGQVSTVYASHGERLGVIAGDDLRIPVAGSDIPKNLKDATVAIEDQRFYEHGGLDYEGIARAALKNAKAGGTCEGGSTITQQVVKNLYISSERTYQRKIKEAKLAEELEKKRSKAWILDTYLNTVPYGTAGGQSAIGARAAARIYFDKPVQKLTLDEAALMAGLPQAPTSYSPFKFPAAAQARRNLVLRKMLQLKMITPGQTEKAIAKKVDTDSVKGSKFFTARREKYFFDYVKDELLKEYGAKTVQQGGLKVYTTIDLAKQKAARASIQKSLAGVGPSSAIVTIDPKNGYIKAMASSAEYGQSKFNLAAQGKRQPGSSFKVMTLMTALRKGVSPTKTTYVSRSPMKLSYQGAPFEIKTYSGSSGGSMNLVEATLRSDNSAYIQLALDLGPDEVKKTARMLGIKSVLKGYPAESLGGLERGVSPLEMANAYATIVSGGFRSRPTVIKKVRFPDGRVEQGTKLPRRFRVKRTKAFDSSATYEAVKILEQNVKSGTGTHAAIGCPAAGKTGTTDKNTDAWFVGFTQRLSTAVWVGYPGSRVEMNGLYPGGRNVDGGTFPADIWGDYMKTVTRGSCGEFRKASRPFQTIPFFGKYSRSGGASDPNDPGNPDDPNPDFSTPAPPVRSIPPTTFNPDAYEAPPQKKPKTAPKAAPKAKSPKAPSGESKGGAKVEPGGGTAAPG